MNIQAKQILCMQFALMTMTKVKPKVIGGLLLLNQTLSWVCRDKVKGQWEGHEFI